jgi:hypothetical protein
MNVEQLVEWKLAEEAKVLREIPSQCQFAKNKSVMA